MLCGIGFSCESPLTLIPLSVLPWAFVVGVESQEILQTLSAENFAVILEGEDFRVFAEGWALSQLSCGPRAPEPSACSPGGEGRKHKGSL